jgi:hypothetical protein
MRQIHQKQAAARVARLTALGAGILLLAGCATGYSFVQPDVAGSGGYYTSEGPYPYSGQGYYDDYGTGPYYSGTSGYGYYNGTWPYDGAYGYYGPGYGYGPQWTFNVGISNVWNFPGYWGPWYTAGFPLGGCYSWRCGGRHYRHGHHHNGSGSWRHDDTSTSPPDVAQTGQDRGRDFAAGRERAMEMTAWRHDHMVRSPRQGPAGSFAGIPAYPARIAAPRPGQTSFAGRRAGAMAAPVAMPAPSSFSRAPRAAPRADVARGATPVRSAPAPAVRAPTRSSAAPATKVQ